MRISKGCGLVPAILFALFAVGAAVAQMSSAKPAGGAPASDKGSLRIYFVDVEGGQSTLFVAPSGESMLVDTGSPDRNTTAPRDASRIAAVCKLAGVTKIDNLVITHYHSDHVGGLPQLVALVPVGRFIDHGLNTEGAEVQGGSSTIAGYNAYQKVLADTKADHLTVKPGDVLPIKAFKVEIVSGNGDVIAKPLPAGGQPNPACATSPKKDPEGDENERSLGMVITFGKTRILDLGDLTWAKEPGLVCPVNKLGKFDVYVASHHGLDRSGSPALVDAVAPRIAVIDNSGRKGAAATTVDTIRGSGRLEGLWQLHTAEGNDAAHNTAESQIANLPGPDAGNYLELSVHPSGGISVTNPRTGGTVDYPAK
jgi:beta-lactamase superfamily II metal-dependent hydrolase